MFPCRTMTPSPCSKVAEVLDLYYYAGIAMIPRDASANLALFLRLFQYIERCSRAASEVVMPQGEGGDQPKRQASQQRLV